MLGAFYLSVTILGYRWLMAHSDRLAHWAAAYRGPAPVAWVVRLFLWGVTERPPGMPFWEIAGKRVWDLRVDTK